MAGGRGMRKHPIDGYGKYMGKPLRQTSARGPAQENIPTPTIYISIFVYERYLFQIYLNIFMSRDK